MVHASVSSGNNKTSGGVPRTQSVVHVSNAATSGSNFINSNVYVVSSASSSSSSSIADSSQPPVKKRLKLSEDVGDSGTSLLVDIRPLVTIRKLLLDHKYSRLKCVKDK